MRILLIISLLVFSNLVYGQDKQDVVSYFDLIKPIVSSEKLGNNLFYRLDTLRSKFIPSRSRINDYFNRNIEFGFKHRRINLSLNFVNYQIDLLCSNDTIFLSTVRSDQYRNIKYDYYNSDVLDGFLQKRNKLYNSTKDPQQLIEELAFSEEYAFYCGDVRQKTPKGEYIEQLVDEERIDELIDMLKSFNCETQAYGVAGFNMLAKKEYEVPSFIEKLIVHIKKRNSELIVCSGCISGIVNKIYSRK